jgi:hypothetical protein
MVFGDSGGDSNIFMFASCQSIQYCVWDNGGYWPTMNNDMAIMLGFHGDMYDSLDNDYAYGAYVRDTATDGLGDNWLDWLYTESDQCPTAVVKASSGSVATNYYDHGGLKDFQSTGTATMSSIFYLCGCDPSNGEALPSC